MEKSKFRQDPPSSPQDLEWQVKPGFSAVID